MKDAFDQLAFSTPFWTFNFALMVMEVCKQACSWNPPTHKHTGSPRSWVPAPMLLRTVLRHCLSRLMYASACDHQNASYPISSSIGEMPNSVKFCENIWHGYLDNTLFFFIMVGLAGIFDLQKPKDQIWLQSAFNHLACPFHFQRWNMIAIFENEMDIAAD